MGTGSTPQAEIVRADRWTRVMSYLIDLLPAMLLGLVGVIPIVGFVIAGMILGPYWLLRDSLGGSLGKVLLGLRVVSPDGSPSNAGARVVRNIPLALGPALFAIPLLGLVLAPPVILVALVVETISLLAHGERLGDRLAGTVVVRRSSLRSQNE